MPIPSVEKYLKRKLVDEPDRDFIKLLGDKYFIQRSLPSIIADYQNDPRTAKSKDTDGKILYSILLSNLAKIDILERDFVKYIADDIYSYENPQSFVTSLTKLLI